MNILIMLWFALRYLAAAPFLVIATFMPADSKFGWWLFRVSIKITGAKEYD